MSIQSEVMIDDSNLQLPITSKLIEIQHSLALTKTIIDAK